jgi:hypothetical protein
MSFVTVKQTKEQTKAENITFWDVMPWSLTQVY